MVVMMSRRRAIIFTFDALLGAMLILAGLLYALHHAERPAPVTTTSHYVHDAMLALSTITVGEIDDPWIQRLISNTNVSNSNYTNATYTILEQAGSYWAKNRSDLAQNLTTLALMNLLPPSFSYSFAMNSTEIASHTGTGSRRQSVVARRMITGIQQGSALEGSTSTAYLKRIRGRSLSKYVYFGGFVGQGNLTALLTLPSDLNASRVTAFLFEADMAAPFQLLINGQGCNTSDAPTGTFTPNASNGNFTPESWNLLRCNSSLHNGTNLFTFRFPGGVNDAYIGGGYLKVTYSSAQFQETTSLGSSQKTLPGIEGIVNLYDAFNVPGTLTGIDIMLHYIANHTAAQNYSFYLTVGNATLLMDSNSTTEQRLTITNSTIANLLNFSGFNYSQLSNTTVPFRVGFQNLTFTATYTGAADVAIVTDVSGSMDYEMGSNDPGHARACNASSFNNSDTSRLSVAKCLDAQFASDIINITGNKLGLVSYSTSTVAGQTVAPTTNLTQLSAMINSYSTVLYTCICCGITTAQTQLVAGAVSRAEVIASGSSWKYWRGFVNGTPQNDSSNRTWLDPDYTDTSWSSGNAILGTNNSFIYTPAVTTDIGGNFSRVNASANLWEYFPGDNAGAPNDFTSNLLNSTANTFGIGGANDGWDWDTRNGTGPFGYDDDISYRNVTTGALELNTSYPGAGGPNVCTGGSCSGAYGISVNITPELYGVVSSGGRLTLSFDYDWASNPTNPFESSDETWVKARWTSPTTGDHYLGSELSSVGGDTTLEVARTDNPDTEFSGTFSQEIQQWIEGTGMYYLALGVKLNASGGDEWGRLRLDNIGLTGVYDPDTIYANLWEYTGDLNGPPADFSSGMLNTTGSDYGISGANDGWDHDATNNSGPFGYDDEIDYALSSGQIQFDNDDGSNDNNCADNDCSGAYGITVNITPAMYDLITENGSASLSFKYYWYDDSSNSFESSDEVWVKARWTSPTSGQHDLGRSLDNGHDGSDASLEIAAGNNPDTDIAGVYAQDLSSFIEGSGLYYLELGGAVLADSDNEIGHWGFDDVQLRITNRTNHYYFRKHFTISNISQVGRGVLNLLMDDTAVVYVNGNLLIPESDAHLAEYWNRRGVKVPRTDLRQGDNVVAVELQNSDGAAKFDLELALVNQTRDAAMMVMSDGVANRQCGGGSDEELAKQEAIQAACDAREDYGISVYAVGYSDEADEGTLEGIAACGEGLFKKSSDTAELREFYNDVAYSIIDATIQAQTVVVSGAFERSLLFNDSYINITYVPVSGDPLPEELELVFQSSQFNSCSPAVPIHADIRLIDASITSYSGSHWTDLVTANGQVAYNLSRFGSLYAPLGDPSVVMIPTSMLISGALNNLTVRTGDEPQNSTGCSPNNTLMYRGFINSSTPRSEVVADAFGCNWTVSFSDGTNMTTAIGPHPPLTRCNYTPASYNGSCIPHGACNPVDAYDLGVARILSMLDFDGDGRVDVNLNQEDLEIIVTVVSGIPYLWGPTIATLEVWR
jgi:hypothetical protein